MLTFGILIASDRSFRGEREDCCAPLLKELIESRNWKVLRSSIVPDEQTLIEKELIRLSEEFECDVVLTSGGTGLSARDVTPEATLRVIEKQVPGIPELLRLRSMALTEHAVLSRAVAGMRRKTLLINLPGNPEAVRQSFLILEPLLEHAVGLICGKEPHLNHAGQTK